MIHGPPPTWPVVTGVSFSHCSAGEAVDLPSRDVQRVLEQRRRVPGRSGHQQDLVVLAAVLLAKSGVNTLSGGTAPFLISGSSRLATRVQCASPELMRSLLAANCSSGHWSPHR